MLGPIQYQKTVPVSPKVASHSFDSPRKFRDTTNLSHHRKGVEHNICAAIFCGTIMAIFLPFPLLFLLSARQTEALLILAHGRRAMGVEPILKEAK